MSESDETDLDERELQLLADALADELIPTTESEVERAEENDVEHSGQLPAQLERAFRDNARPSSQQRDNVVSLQARRGATGWLTHVAAVAIGAAAATAVFMGTRDQTGETTPSSEPAGALSADAQPPVQKKIELTLRDACESCCGGAACGSAREGLESCPSGRRCVPCDPAQLKTTRYRVRLSSVLLDEYGKELVAKMPGGRLMTCVRSGGSKRECVPSHPNDDNQGPWATLPLVLSARDLQAGAEVSLRWEGLQGLPVAKWSKPVALSAEGLCRGLSIKLASVPKENAFGQLSLFLIDTHYVELARAPDVAGVEERARGFGFRDLQPQLVETSSEHREQRFGLVLGPLTLPQAEELRWQVLRAGGEARVTIGAEHRGAPRALKLP